ncbi:hypothetical protein [Zhongshania sp.]|uniref:bestrophin-like domain n=1 Tax=Zhongshania sp. TaxID=1971902 RepID=UPI002A81024E|nr:hypothetical protein [Zhongshania sp.]
MAQPFLYNYDSLLITGILFLLIVLLNEVGFRIGRFVQHSTDSEVKTLTGSIQGSILGLLALLLGFTFSMSMQRFDGRSEALIAEANAIGTASLRVQLLPVQFQDEANALLARYVDMRIAIGKGDLSHALERKKYNQTIAALQSELWALAVAATNADPRPVTSGAFVNSLNEMIDSQGKRNALQQMRVPEVVLLLLFTVFIASGGMLGYSSGLSGKRVVAPTLMVSFLIAMIVFIIIDLDRPKRGLIMVDQSSLLALQNAPVTQLGHSN